MPKLVSSCHITKIVANDYGFKLIKIVKIIVGDYDFRIKLKSWLVTTILIIKKNHNYQPRF